MMSKHPVAEQKQKIEKQVWQIGVWSDYDKATIPMTLEKSVRDVIKNHNCADYGISKEKFDESKENASEFMQTMKRCDYQPALINGKFLPSNGMYRFVHTPKITLPEA
jgi:hypothetical protein